MSFYKIGIRGLIVLLLLCLGFSEAGATMALPLSLTQLTQQADRIFVGKCLSTSTELDENGIPSTYTRFEVKKGLKGIKTGGILLIKHLGSRKKMAKVKEGESALVSPKSMSLEGVGYREGGEYFLFLYPDSRLGFTSPVGAGQGFFEVTGSELTGGLVLEQKTQSSASLVPLSMNVDQMIRAVEGMVQP